MDLARDARPLVLASGLEARGERPQLLVELVALNRDAGYDPVYAGGMDKTAVQEQGIGLILAIGQASGQFFYRMAPPDEL